VPLIEPILAIGPLLSTPAAAPDRQTRITALGSLSRTRRRLPESSMERPVAAGMLWGSREHCPVRGQALAGFVAHSFARSGPPSQVVVPMMEPVNSLRPTPRLSLLEFASRFH